MLDYDYVFICVVLELIHDYSYLTIWVYNGYINDFKNKNAKITTVLFDDKYEMITKRQNVNDVPMLSFDNGAAYTQTDAHVAAAGVCRGLAAQ